MRLRISRKILKDALLTDGGPFYSQIRDDYQAPRMGRGCPDLARPIRGSTWERAWRRRLQDLKRRRR